MDASRFDSWTRAVGSQSGRRALLRGIAGAAVALGAVSVVGERTDAKKKKCDKKTKKKCAKQGLACEKGKCVLGCNARNAQCLGNFAVLLCGDPKNHTCACSRLLEGGFTCAETLHDADQNCPAASECEQNSDCPDGEVCIDASEKDQCCGSPGFGLCQKQCKI
jgi:hypothetical protein